MYNVYARASRGGGVTMEKTSSLSVPCIKIQGTTPGAQVLRVSSVEKGSEPKPWSVHYSFTCASWLSLLGGKQ